MSYVHDTQERLEVVRSPEVELEIGGDTVRLETSYAYESAGSSLAEQLNRGDNLVSIIDPRLETWLELAYEAGSGQRGHRLENRRGAILS